jgi:DNA-binding CsgD family transcriptional regulator
MFLKNTINKKTLSKNESPVLMLTRRQGECLRYIADGCTARHIAYRLGISERMVRFHLEGARKRLGAGSTTQAVYLATKAGLID